jgi:hypothetical protein
MRKSTFHGRADGRDHPRGGLRTVSTVAKRHGISEQMIYTWRKRFRRLSGERCWAVEAARSRGRLVDQRLNGFQGQSSRLADSWAQVDGGKSMAAELNHTIVWLSDQTKSARFLAEMLGRPAPVRFGHFDVVELDNGVSLDFAHGAGPIRP